MAARKVVYLAALMAVLSVALRVARMAVSTADKSENQTVVWKEVKTAAWRAD